MKVIELLENEWENVPVTLEYLRKKQLHACNQFKIELNRLGKLYPHDDALQGWVNASV